MTIVLFCVLAGAVCALLCADAAALRGLDALPADPPADTGGAVVSIVIPARNEARVIARCLDGALAQTGCDVDIVVVDDASTDATAAILAGYAERSARTLRALSGRPLPAGWVGKCNACDWGARQTRAFARPDNAWLLFLDADTHAGPGLARALLAETRRRDLDMLSALPHNELGTLSERVILPVFFQFIFAAFPLRRLRDPQMPPEYALANGQCLFVRASAYRAVDGHAVVKDKVLEDVEFAQALRRAGFRVGLAQGRAHIAVRMYHSLGEVVEGLGKHALAGRRRAGARAFVAVGHLLATAVAPALLVLAGAAWLALGGLWPGALAFAGGCAACVAAQLFWGWIYASVYRQPRHYSWLTPFGALAYLLIAARGGLRALAGQGVRWKGRDYAG